MQVITSANSQLYSQPKIKKRINFGVRAKLFASFGALIALIGGVGFVGWQNTHQLAEDAKDLYADKLRGAVSLAEANASLWNLRWLLPQYLLEPEQRQELRVLEGELHKKVKQSLASYRKTELSTKEQQSLEKLEKTYEQYEAARPEFFKLMDAGKTKEATEYRLTHTTPVGQEANKLMDAAIEIQQREGESKYKEVQNSINILTTILTVALFLSLAIASTLAILLGRNITEIILNAVKNITSSSGKISTTVSEQERTILEQTSSVNETTSTIEELGAFTLQSAEQADNAASGAKQALSLAAGGTETVGRTIEGIAGLRDQVTAIANQIIRLSEQTSQISTVSDLVADLASQTNMLALNAGVEAARAGEQGKGFSVVASEVRKLADQSKKSANQINLLVNEVQAAINSTVMVTDEGTKKATVGIELAEETAEAFASIADSVNQVFLNTQQIAQNAKHQAVAVQQVVAAMNVINLGAKETVTGITQVKEATNNLNEAADSLEAVM